MAESSADTNKLRVRRLCSSVSNPCYLVTFRDVTILLDCPLDLSSLSYFLPQHSLAIPGASCNPGFFMKPSGICPEIVKVEDRSFFDAELEVAFLTGNEMDSIVWDMVDVILISNFITISGLPFITERTKFRGKIFATDPTVEFGKIQMYDNLDSLGELPRQTKTKSTGGKQTKDLPYPLVLIQSLDCWKKFYTKEEVDKCLSKIERIAYNQPLNLFGLLEVRGVSAGYGIGSCNWILKTDYEKISYISQSSIAHSHTMLIDYSAFKGSDVLIIGSVSQHANTSLEKTVADFCNKAIKTLRDGGNVLVPCLVSGFVLDLIEALESALVQAKLERYPMYLISPQSRSSLAYANIYAEWLNAQKEALVYRADAPFIFENLSKSDHLIAFPNLHDPNLTKMRSPCIAFASHPSLRLGPAVHLLKTWGKNPNNALILVASKDYVPNYSMVDMTTGGMIEPSIDEEHLLAPFQPLQLKVYQCNMDSRVAPHQMGEFISAVCPRRAAVIPYEYAHLPIIVDTSASHSEAFSLSLGQPLDLAFPPRPEKVEVDPILAASLCPTHVSSDQYITLLDANLVTRDGKHRLTAPSIGKGIPGGPALSSQRPAVVGKMDPQRLIQELHSRGLVEAKLDTIREDSHIVFFNDSNTLIQMEPRSTHIICDDEVTRVKVRDALVACLTQIGSM